MMLSRAVIGVAIAFSFVVIRTSMVNAYFDVVIDPWHCVAHAGTDGYGGPEGINECVRALEIWRGERRALLDCYRLAPGPYIIQLDAGDEVARKKVIVLR